VSATPSTGLLEEVGLLMRDVAARAILPRFRALNRLDIEEKSPGELVTVADREAEQLLSHALVAALPGSRAVGEESCARNPRLLAGLDQDLVWLIDPLDGTSNFVAGSECFSVMVALLRAGETIAAFMLDPLTDVLCWAERGGGAYQAGQRVQTALEARPAAQLRGAVLTKYMPFELREEVTPRLARIGTVLPGLRCAGAEYPALATARHDFAMFWRTLPWDHAPGTLFLCEAGGVALRFDGSPYRPADGRYGLLAARNRAAWSEADRALLRG
jgi:fructose-1,6-bisphosphatase/inositol monophosphatase family enzyme